MGKSVGYGRGVVFRDTSRALLPEENFCSALRREKFDESRYRDLPVAMLAEVPADSAK